MWQFYPEDKRPEPETTGYCGIKWKLVWKVHNVPRISVYSVGLYSYVCIKDSRYFFFCFATATILLIYLLIAVYLINIYPRVI